MAKQVREVGDPPHQSLGGLHRTRVSLNRRLWLMCARLRVSRVRNRLVIGVTKGNGTALKSADVPPIFECGGDMPREYNRGATRHGAAASVQPTR